MLVGGSSPRLRGTGFSASALSPDHRFIPAPAGNSSSAVATSSRSPVHPRACGEQRRTSRASRTSSGSSPRLRGTVGGVVPVALEVRFIPAPAGNSGHVPRSKALEPVHPRACGEQGARQRLHSATVGSSPRLRGTGENRRYLRLNLRFIPAPAGNSATASQSRRAATVHPRACGEQPSATAVVYNVTGSSPRLRGTGPPGRRGARGHRFIPAPAGNSRSRWPRSGPTPVHPRACGEQ